MDVTVGEKYLIERDGTGDLIIVTLVRFGHNRAGEKVAIFKAKDGSFRTDAQTKVRHPVTFLSANTRSSDEKDWAGVRSPLSINLVALLHGEETWDAISPEDYFPLGPSVMYSIVTEY